MYELWEDLKRLKRCRWVELSHPLNNDSPYWGGIPEGAVELSKTVYDWGNELECLIQTFKFPGQFGTHIDFPGHFIKGEALSEQYGVKDMVFPLVVIDISEKVKENVEYAVTVDDIKGFEAAYGDIPDGAFVALYTGWSRRWPDMDAISNFDQEGGEHFPGWSMEALRYIYEVRNAAANGHETLDTDASVLAARSGDLACERYLLDKGKLQVEVMCNLGPEPLYLQCSLLLREPQDFLSACGPLCRSRFSAYNLWHSGEIRPWQMKPVPAFFRLCRWTACWRALWEQRQCLYIGTA